MRSLVVLLIAVAVANAAVVPLGYTLTPKLPITTTIPVITNVPVTIPSCGCGLEVGTVRSCNCNAIDLFPPCGCLETVLPTCGCNSVLPICGCNSVLPTCGCGCNSMLSTCGCNSVLPTCGCGCNSVLPTCGCNSGCEIEITTISCDCGIDVVPRTACITVDPVTTCGCTLPLEVVPSLNPLRGVIPACGCGCGRVVSACGCPTLPPLPPVVGCCGKYLRQVCVQPPYL